MNILVSIIIPAFNRPKLLIETLESVRNQKFRNWECLVIDDGPSNSIRDVTFQYSQEDKRFKYCQRPETRIKGAASSRNHGLELAKGEVIQFLDDDDILGAEKLYEQLKLYDDHDSLLTCKWGWFNDVSDLNTRFKTKYHCYKNYRESEDLLTCFGLHSEYLPLHNYLIPKKLIDEVGGWNEKLGNNDDAEFLTRLIIKASKIVFAENARVYYRANNLNKLSEFDSEIKLISAIESWKLIQDHLNKKSRMRSLVYVINAKKNLAKIAKKEFPDIYKKESKFLESGNWKLPILKTLIKLSRSRT